jgi:oxalate decarboxylase
MTGIVTRLKPGTMHEPRWYQNSYEWHYVVNGHIRITLFGPDKRMAVGEQVPGDCAYLPWGCVHSIHNIGTGECEIVGALDSGTDFESSLSNWVAKAPRHLLANNMGLSAEDLATIGKRKAVIIDSA